MSITIKLPSLFANPEYIYLGGFIATIFYATYKGGAMEIEKQKVIKHRQLDLVSIMNASVGGFLGGFMYGIAWPFFVPVLYKYYNSNNQ